MKFGSSAKAVGLNTIPMKAKLNVARKSAANEKDESCEQREPRLILVVRHPLYPSQGIRHAQ